MIENAGNRRKRVIGRVALIQDLKPPGVSYQTNMGNSAANAEFPSSLSNKAEFCQFTRKLEAICPSTDGLAPVEPPGGTRLPRRRSVRKTSCRAAIRLRSKPAAPTSRAG